MSKYKYYLCIILWTFMPKIGMAIDLELSDVIKEARETQKAMIKAQMQQNIEQTKKIQTEKSAAEKISKEEIMQLQKNKT